MSHQGYTGPKSDCQNERIIPRHTEVSWGEPNPKQAYGDRKVALATFPSAGLIYGALATAYGARKYGPFNWRDQPVELMTYMHALHRHILAWIDGENDDPETGLPHIGHAIACLAIAADAIETKSFIDNRPTKGCASDVLRRYELTN